MQRFMFLVFLSVTVSCSRIRYDGCQLWELLASNHIQLQQLQLFYQTCDTTDDNSLIFLNSLIGINRPLAVVVCKEGQDKLNRFTELTGISLTLKNKDVQSEIDATVARSAARHETSPFAYDQLDYNTYEDIMQELTVLQSQCPAGFTCSIQTIGGTYEQRDINMFTLAKEGNNRPAIWVDSLIHAREWLSGATVMGILHKLVLEYGTDEDVTSLVDTYDWHFVPVMNPDGYSYTWTTDSYWRKNRSPNYNSTCVGKDLNRNYDYRWGGDGSSGDPCSNNYRGPSAASELETQAVQNAGTTLADSLVLWLTFHTWSMVYLFPYGDEVDGICHFSPNTLQLKRVGQACVDAITATFNETVWTTGNTCEIFYVTSGTTQDWVLGTGVTDFVYTPELRGPDAPPSIIEPSILENWNGLLALIAEMQAIQNGKS